MPAPESTRALEVAGAGAACTAAAVAAEARLLRPEIVQGDALVHQYWMRSYADPELFTDPLTAELRSSERYPDGYEALFFLAGQVIDPIAFGEWLGVGLMAAAGLLVFAIVRTHTAWRPAAWIAAALFLAFDAHRFSGGFPRGFVHVVVLATVLLALRRHHLAAALTAAAGALVYPPASLLALGVLSVSAVRLREGRPRLDPRRAGLTVLAGALAAAAVLGPMVLSGSGSSVMAAAEARAYPEFGAQGGLRVFVPSTLEYLRQNRTGFDLRATGSMLALAALALLLVRPVAVRLLRLEVLAVPVVSLAAFAVAHAVLFKLYLPHRYTYPLVAFFAVAIGVALLPAWRAASAGPRWRLRALALLLVPPAVFVAGSVLFPLGPTVPLERLGEAGALALAGTAILVAAAGALLLGRARAAAVPALGATLTGAMLVAALLAAPDRKGPGLACPQTPVSRFLGSLPKDAIVAGDPIDLKCVVVTARRPVVISTQLAPSYERDYLQRSRARMFAMLRAHYGPSRRAIADLHRRYGATHLWVRRDAVEREQTTDRGRWRRPQEPYGSYVRRLLRAGEPAALQLPERCLRWRSGADEVYDVGCVAGDS